MAHTTSQGGAAWIFEWQSQLSHFTPLHMIHANHINCLWCRRAYLDPLFVGSHTISCCGSFPVPAGQLPLPTSSWLFLALASVQLSPAAALLPVVFAPQDPPALPAWGWACNPPK